MVVFPDMTKILTLGSDVGRVTMRVSNFLTNVYVHGCEQ